MFAGDVKVAHILDTDARRRQWRGNEQNNELAAAAAE